MLAINRAGLALVGAGSEDAVPGLDYLAFVSPSDKDRVRRLNRTHAVLARCNRSLARALAEREILDAFCTNLVEVGGYSFAWVGYAGRKYPVRVRLVAYAGQGYGDFAAAVLAFGIQTARARAAQAQQVRLLRDEVEKDERNRLAAILHDRVGQSMQAVNLGLKRARAMAEKEAPVPAGLLDALIAEVATAIGELRDLSRELRPLFLERACRCWRRFACIAARPAPAPASRSASLPGMPPSTWTNGSRSSVSWPFARP